MIEASNLTFLIAFFAGLVSFLAPCFLGVLPVWGILTLGLKDKGSAGGESLKRKAFLNSLAFIFGFLLIFICLGLFANFLGRHVAPYRAVIQKAGGIFMIVLGLSMLGFFKLPFLMRTFRFDVDKSFRSQSLLASFVFGSTFGFAWTPCVGPVLALIFFWSGQLETAGKGLWFLLFYSMGFVLPFLLISLFFSRAVLSLNGIRRAGYFLNLFFGTLIIFIGLLLVFNKLGILIGHTLSVLSRLGM